jgi:hypothetical protein
MNTLAREEQERTAMMEAIQSKTAKSVAEILEETVSSFMVAGAAA